jgi:hypothetical protein
LFYIEKVLERGLQEIQICIYKGKVNIGVEYREEENQGYKSCISGMELRGKDKTR